MNWQLLNWYKTIVISLFIVVGPAASSQSSSPPVVVVASLDIQTWVGKKLPNFTLHDVNGKLYTNESVRGKLTVINLWSTTCHPCIDEIPLLNKLVGRYIDQDIVFLAPAPEILAKIKPVLTRQNFKYVVLPQAHDLFGALNLPGYPYHILVDRNGYVRFIRTGTINLRTGQKIAEIELPTAIDKELN